MNLQPIYELQHVKKMYNGRVVLDIPNITIRPQAMYAVVGPNGAGKSTLLKILSFLEKPTEGTVHFNGHRVDYSANGSPALRRQVTFVLQDPFLFRTTVLKNVTYGLWIRGMKRKEREKKAYAVLDIVGLSAFAKEQAERLSGGEVQRVAIARALATNPKVLLLDEPTANVDRPYAAAIEEALKNINAQYGTTILLATHNLKQAYCCADTVVSLLRGKVTASHPDNLFKGTITEKDGRKWLSLHEGCGFYVITDRVGPAYASVDPKEIIISTDPLTSSALNCLKGTIIGINREGAIVRLTIDAGIPFVSLITMTSFTTMNLNINSRIHLTFKATAVEVY
jgi:tungstate transport system ATP-binding protein